MTVVNPKSISGINSITTGSGSDNLLTIHTSDANNTERVRINSSGDVIVGSGVTLSPDGDAFFTGVTTATTFSGAFSGSGANITALNASNISSGTVPTARLGSGTASSSTFLRGDSTFQTVNTDLVSDTSPQLGGDLDLNGNDILLDDNEKIFIGTSNDGSLFNTGSYLFLKNHNGAVAIQGTNTISLQKYDNSDIGLQYIVDGAVELYHDNTKQCETAADGLAFPSGKGINFNLTADASGTGVTAGSETLDDYEEGSWTPVLFGQTGSTNTTGRATAFGHYTKIGNRVLINFFVEANTGSAGGNIRVAGLPFAPSSTPTHQWCGSFNWYSPGGAQSGSHYSAWVNSKLYLTNGDTNMRLLYHEAASNDATLRTADWSAVGTNATYGYFRVAHNFQYFTDA